MSLNTIIRQYLIQNRIRIRTFEKSIGCSNGVIGKFINHKTSLSSNTVERICELYPDIKRAWGLSIHSQKQEEPSLTYEVDNRPATTGRKTIRQKLRACLSIWACTDFEITYFKI
jgi:hypothetical protein